MQSDPQKPTHKVLVVDDSEIALDVVRAHLEPEGFEVTTMDTPFGFAGALTRLKPDVVLLDVEMPALQGDQLMNIARKHWRSPLTVGKTLDPRPQRSFIVLYSDRPISELEELAQRCGADACVKKSGDFGPLLQTLRNLLNT